MKITTLCLLFVVQSLSLVWLFVTPWTAAHQTSLFFTVSQSLLKLMSLDSVMPSNHLILSIPLLLPSMFPSIKVFSSELAQEESYGQSIGASVSVLPMNIYCWFPLEINWLELLAVQGILKSLLQHHNLKVSILWHSAFFMIQISHWYMTPGKTVALTIWTFISKVMSLLFNMLSGFVIAFLPRSKHLLILELQSLSAMILELKKIKICHTE